MYTSIEEWLREHKAHEELKRLEARMRVANVCERVLRDAAHPIDLFNPTHDILDDLAEEYYALGCTIGCNIWVLRSQLDMI